MIIAAFAIGGIVALFLRRRILAACLFACALIGLILTGL